MAMNEKEFKKWMLERISDILEETSQVSQDSCPFCCQPEYPVKEICGEYVTISIASPPYVDDEEEDEWTMDDVDEWHLDHYDDCLITILEEQYKKIEEDGIWC